MERWVRAGVVVFGRTNTPEFGAKGITEPEAWGLCRNPWNPAHTPGGSSGGSAAVVAAGIVPIAGANDGGGSIRLPAAHCGLRSEEHTYELQSLMRISYAVFCFQTNKKNTVYIYGMHLK